MITEEPCTLIERLLLERISLLRDLSRGGCRAPVAFTVYGCTVPGGTRASSYQATSKPPGSDPATAGGRAGRALELCGEQREPAVGMNCYGRHDLLSHCLLAVARAPTLCGRRFLSCIKSRRRSTRISMQSTGGSFPPLNTGPSPSWPARGIMWSASTVRCDNGSPAWCVARFRSLRSSATILVPSNTSFVTTTSPDVQHYLDSTTCILSLFDHDVGHGHVWRHGRCVGCVCRPT